MIPVADAVQRIVSSIERLPNETISLNDGLGRVLAKDLVARRTQPPFSVSAMDGYAVIASETNSELPVSLKVIGTIPAGQKFSGYLSKGQAVRIFTGARMPTNADAVVIQENTIFDSKTKMVVLNESVKTGNYVRSKGLDFSLGDMVLTAGMELNPRRLALAAAMNIPWLDVVRRPQVAIISSGDEIVLPGDPIGENQIVSSNGIALVAAIKSFGGIPIQVGIARDNRQSLLDAVSSSKGADLLITTGGASVGEHDLVKEVLSELGLELDFWKIAMRPGKPLMFGALSDTKVIGLPGNPVSSLICAQIFVRPAINKMLGINNDPQEAKIYARLVNALGPNDERQDYLRASLSRAGDGTAEVKVFNKQDSSMGSLLAKADCLVIRKPNAPCASIGDFIEVLQLNKARRSI